MNTRIPKFGSIDGLRKLIGESRSMAEVARKCGYADAGGTVAYLRRKAKLAKISVDHFLGSGWSKGKTRQTDRGVEKQARSLDRPWTELFCLNSTAKNATLLKRLILSGKRKDCCEECGLAEWRGRKIRQQLHHCNGDNTDCREENLQILCPMCHSFTDNFAGRNKRSSGVTAAALHSGCNVL